MSQPKEATEPRSDIKQNDESHSFRSEGQSGIDPHELLKRVLRGLDKILGLALLGLVIGALGYLLVSRFEATTTTTRVMFSFPGFENGEYPDHSKFQADDLRAPTVLNEALTRQGIDSTLQSRIRGALSIEGIVAPNIVRERDRMRASGQTPPPFNPDEYEVTLTLKPSLSLSSQQRKSLLLEIVSVYRENFQRTYASVPLAFGGAFSVLRKADYPEYELILRKEVESITAYLNQQIEKARSFRSQTTNLSFKDLLEQTEIFDQTKITETLGLVHENGLSRNRRTAMVKMDYYLRTLEDQENAAIEEEKVVQNLLSQSRLSDQNYVLGIKTQATQPHSENPILDEGLIESLLANDARNFLIHQALDVGLKVKRVQAEKLQVSALRENMKSFLSSAPSDQTLLLNQVQKSFDDLEQSYKELIDNIRKTNADFTRQQLADAIRMSDEVRNASLIKPMAMVGLAGFFLGLAAGLGLTLLRAGELFKHAPSALDH